MDSPPTGADVARFLGRSQDQEMVALAGEHVRLVTAFVSGYTRGIGFEDPTDSSSDLEPDLRAVIVTATARLVTNPAQTDREGADGWFAVGSFNGFSLPELAVLHRYRQRTA